MSMTPDCTHTRRLTFHNSVPRRTTDFEQETHSHSSHSVFFFLPRSTVICSPRLSIAYLGQASQEQLRLCFGGVILYILFAATFVWTQILSA